MEQHLMISADCHAAPRLDDARGYVESKWHGAFDAWRAALERRMAEESRQRLFAGDASEGFQEEEKVAGGGFRGIWNSERRLQELDADGIVAEVIFPGGATTPGAEAGACPFDVGISTYRTQQDPELWMVGCRAYNRWLADLCNDAPGRRAGVGLIAVEDVDEAVEEVRWLREHGVFGGILLPGGAVGIGSLPPAYNHSRYEPLWAVCHDLEMPIHTHSGWVPEFGNGLDAIGIMLSEMPWWAHRPFWFMLWSGVFERHPKLQLVMTEQKADWLLPLLELLDSRYEGPMFRQLRNLMPMKPSEYYHRQCFIGASYMDEGEWEARHALGVGKLMWGSDYPHLEGSWPHTVDRLGQTFKDVPREEVGRMIGLTAAEVYGFDLDQLMPLAATHGPRIDRIGC